MERWAIIIIKDCWNIISGSLLCIYKWLQKQTKLLQLQFWIMQNHIKIIEDDLKNHFIPAIIGKPPISELLR